MRPGRAAAIVLAAALAGGVPAADDAEKPKEVGLMERASTRLAQLDVTVSGSKEAIRNLSIADFEVRLNDKLVSGLIVDDLCLPAGTAATAPAPAPAPAPGDKAAAPPPAPRGPGASYLFYFDMPHLTQGGRRGAIDAARSMLPKLLTGGNRAMLVVNAGELKTLVLLTDDLKSLEDALEKMINDPKLFDAYAATEDKRLADINHEMSISIDAAVTLATRYASEERFQQERDLRRLSMVLGRFADVDPPKAALYFADTMRQNPGEHYLSYFSGSVMQNSNGVPQPGPAKILNDAATGSLPLDRVMNEASSYGVRFYTVEGQGITGPDSSILSMSSPSRPGSNGMANQAMPTASTQRTRDAQETLSSLAAETGGRSFLNGVAPAKMASQITDDMSCVYLLSFDPRGFPQDKPLAVAVTVKRPKVKVAVRGRLVIQSEESRLTARVLSAFATGHETAGTTVLRAGIVPVSYTDGHFKARVQVAVPGSVVPDATWDLGASLVTKGAVWEDGSGRVEVKQPGVPVAFERDMEFAPGEFELVAVAHEVTTDTLLSHQTSGKFPDVDVDRASVAPIAVSQQARGGFLRNGTSLTQGALIVPDGEPLQPGVPTAIIALVCRAKDQKSRLTVSRTLIGEKETPVGTTDLELGKDERCGQIVDLIPAKFLGPGAYRFTIAVSSQGTELARSERALVVPEKPPAAGS
ncbi:MAG TPA: hypothetical protein VFV19_12725 [Candidatus Polarisedimenticolaceae bacterium]|nr:hypothetical protein [Candidatus Polarisedimenticolaceae bacterium]